MTYEVLNEVKMTKIAKNKCLNRMSDLKIKTL